jgi:hypothetical protein
MDDSLFFRIEENKSLLNKLKKKTIEFNYDSQLKYDDLLYLKDKESVQIWNIAEIKGKIAIPESYLLFQSVDEDGLHVFYDERAFKYKIIIVKDAKLIAQFSLKNFTKTKKNILSYQYALDIKEHSLDDTDYETFLTDQIDKVNILELLRLNAVIESLAEKFDHKKVLNFISLPILIVTVVFASFSYYRYTKSELNYQTVQQKYATIKKKTQSIKDEMEKQSKKENFWKEFTAKYDRNNATAQILEKVAKVTHAYQGVNIEKIEIDHLVFRVTIYNIGEHEIGILRDLNKIEAIKELKVERKIQNVRRKIDGIIIQGRVNE